MRSQVCAVQHFQPHTGRVIYAAAEPLIIHRLHHPRAPLRDLWYLPWVQHIRKPASGGVEEVEGVGGDLTHLPHCCFDPQPDKEGVADAFSVSGSQLDRLFSGCKFYCCIITQ